MTLLCNDSMGILSRDVLWPLCFMCGELNYFTVQTDKILMGIMTNDNTVQWSFGNSDSCCTLVSQFYVWRVELFLLTCYEVPLCKILLGILSIETTAQQPWEFHLVMYSGLLVLCVAASYVIFCSVHYKVPLCANVAHVCRETRSLCLFNDVFYYSPPVLCHILGYVECF